MDKASDFGSEDCEFESRRGRYFLQHLKNLRFPSLHTNEVPYTLILPLLPVIVLHLIRSFIRIRSYRTNPGVQYLFFSTPTRNWKYGCSKRSVVVNKNILAQRGARTHDPEIKSPHALPTELAGQMLQYCINSDIISVTTIDKSIRIGFALCRPGFFHF